MTKNEAVQVNLIYLIFKLVHFLVDTSGTKLLKIDDIKEFIRLKTIKLIDNQTVAKRRKMLMCSI